MIYIQSSYPQFNLEDKVALNGGGFVTHGNDMDQKETELDNEGQQGMETKQTLVVASGKWHQILKSRELGKAVGKGR